MLWTRPEKLVLTIVAFSSVSILAFVLILWAGRRLSEPPVPGDEGFAAYTAELGSFVADEPVPGEARSPETVVRELEAFRLEMGREVVAAEGQIVTIIAHEGDRDGRLAVVLRGKSLEWLHCFFEPDQNEALRELEPGDRIRVRGVAADWEKKKKGLYLCRIAATR